MDECTRTDEARTRQLRRKFRDCRLPDLVIDGYTVCFHARLRMAARLIEPEWVAQALHAPSRPLPDDLLKRVGDKAMCVINEERKVIITVGYGRLNEPGAVA